MFKVFKKRLLSFIRRVPNSIYNIHNPLGVKYLTRLRIGFSHLKEHKFKHNFQDSIDPTCSCSSGIETTIHFFLHCANFNIQRQTLFDKIAAIDANILKIVLLIFSYLENQIVKIPSIKQFNKVVQM